MSGAQAQTITRAPIEFIDLGAQRRRLDGRIEEAMLRVVRHGKYIMGPEVGELEKRLAAFCDAKHVIACANGTDALALSLLALGIGRGDAVFVPAFTFVATAEPVASLGATPVFVDVEAGSFNMDLGSFEAAVAAAKDLGLTPRAVIPVDLFGQPADYRRILPLAARLGLFVIADAAQSFGASLDNRRVGSMGTVATTSFFPAKPLGCYGDGGAVFTDNDEIATVMRSLRVHGQGSDKYDNVRIGVNSRLDTVQAAVLIEKLSIFEDEIVARQAVADRYNAGLADIAQVPRLMPGATSVWAQYTLVLERRDAVAKALKAEGIPTAIYYPIPLSKQTGYRQFPSAPGGVPVSELLSQQVLSLPMHPYLDHATQDHIIDVIRRAV